MTPRERLVTRAPSVSLEEASGRCSSIASRAAARRRAEPVRGLVTMRDLKLHKQKAALGKDARGRLRVGAAVGATGDFLDRAAALVEQETDVLLLDVAHADSDVTLAAAGELRQRFPRLPLVVGNVRRRAARAFADRGRCDQGGRRPRRGCRTRLETGPACRSCSGA